MTQDEIIEMARQTLSKDIDGLWLAGTPDLEAFAALVEEKATAIEREALKQIIRETPFSNWFQADVIEAIDKRGQA
jgi:hypothetical protein